MTTTDIVLEVVRDRASDLPSAIGPDTTLGDDGLGFDSIACLELILALENRMGVRFRNEDISEEALATIGGIVAYIDAHVGFDGG